MATQPRLGSAAVASLVWISVGVVEASRVAAEEQPPNSISIWTRPVGLAARDAPDVPKATLSLASFSSMDSSRMDAQYLRQRDYRGIPLAALIAAGKPAASVDLALLHFGNGMAIPLPFRDEAVMKRLDPILATGIRMKPGEAFRMGKFPAVAKPGEGKDGRPIVFGANKVVVAERWHPMVPAGAASGPVTFSPWTYADSLVDIELVRSEPYYAQFDVGTEPLAKAGFAVFRQACQFCHGARKIGAQHGWDFVEPAPLFEHRKPAGNLYFHIKLNPADALPRGLMMPALSFVTEEDAKGVWQFMKALAERPLRPYTPEPGGKR